MSTIDIRPQIADSEIDLLRTDLIQWFAGLAKGTCTVEHFSDNQRQSFWISRGSYLRTFAHWQGAHVTFTSFRPASEDVVVFDPAACQLTIKASLAKDRERYLEAFASHIAKDETLVETANSTPMLTLAPFQNGSFNYEGNGQITGIQLVRVRMKLPGTGVATFELYSEDVPDTLRRQFKGFRLDDGELTSVTLCFEIRLEGERPDTVSVEIEPPSQTDLYHKQHCDIIESYLRDQKVKLL